MFSLFKIFRRSSNVPNLEPGRIQQWEMKICGRLQERLGRVKRKWIYAYFLLLLSLYTWTSFQAIWNAFNRSEVVLKVQPISSHQHIGRTAVRVPSEKAKSMDHTKPIELLIAYVDSIRRNNPAAYDSIQRVRPGLSDSLQFLQTIIK